MPELFVRAALTNLLKPQPLQNGNDLARLKYGDTRHSCNFDGLNSDKLRLETRGTVLAQHLDYFFEIEVKLIQGGGL